MSIQTTFDGLKNKIETRSAEAIEERLEDIVQYAVTVSPVSSGAYVNSFSIGKAGFGGGRSKSSKNAPRGQNEQAKKQEALGNLYTDIQGLTIKQDLEDGNTRYTLRNRSEHAQDVEDGTGWKNTDGYYVFTKIKRKFT